MGSNKWMVGTTESRGHIMAKTLVYALFVSTLTLLVVATATYF